MDKNRLNASGGVIIYTRQNLYASYISFSDKVLLEDQDNIWISIVQGSIKIAICCVYVTNESSPRRRFTNETLFTMLLHRYTWCKENGYTVIAAGDFNAHIGEGGLYGIPNSGHKVNMNGGLLLNFLESTRLRSVNSHPLVQGVWTYENPALNHRSAIDMILYDESVGVNSAYIDDKQYILQVDSDHNMVVGEFNVNLERKEPVPTRNLWKRFISETERDAFTRTVDAKIEELPMLLDNPYCSLVATVRDSALLYYGRPVRRSPRRPYQSRELRGVRRKLRSVKREFKHYPNLTDRERDNFHMRLFQIREEKRHLERLAEIKKQEKRWESWIRSSNGVPGRLGDFMRRVKFEPNFKSDLSNSANVLLQTPEQISKELCDFVHSIYLQRFWENTVPPATMVHHSLHNIISEEMNEQLITPITIEEVNAAIKFLKLGTSSGATDIIPEALRALGIESRFALNRLFQNWLEFGIIPPEAQMSRVTLLHKSGRRDLIQNYRTLSVSCNIFKLFTRILYMRLMRVVESSKVLGETQNGFRPGRRATDNLFILKTIFERAHMQTMNKKVFTAFMDLMKAYDRVSRDLLFYKLEIFGFHPNFIRVLRSMYSSVSVELNWNGVLSGPITPPIGLKQGCVLFPILFALYMADLNLFLQDRGDGVRIGNTYLPMLQFADDIVVLAQYERDFKLLLNAIAVYMDLWHLEISEKKSKVLVYGMPFSAERRWCLGTFQTSLNVWKDLSLGEVSEIKYLGLNLTRSNDIFRLTKKNIPSTCRKNKWQVTIPAERLGRRIWFGSTIWESYVVPQLLYGCEVITYDKQSLRKLEIGQNDVLRTLCHTAQCTPIMGLYGVTKRLPLEYEVRKRQLCYARYLSQLPSERVVRNCFDIQLQWYYDGMVSKPWAKQLFDFGEKISLPQVDMWIKSTVKTTLLTYFLNEYQNAVRTRESLRFMRDVIIPQRLRMYSLTSASDWWLKMKLGGVLLNTRTNALGLCLCCDLGVPETPSHFFRECEGLHPWSEKYIRSLPECSVEWTPLEVTTWAFSIERKSDERETFGELAEFRWKSRNLIVSLIN